MLELLTPMLNPFHKFLPLLIELAYPQKQLIYSNNIVQLEELKVLSTVTARNINNCKLSGKKRKQNIKAMNTTSELKENMMRLRKG